MTTETPEGTLALDPFGYQVGVMSRLPGFGGDNYPPDPSYAFHTPYVEAANGTCNFVIRFVGLRAKRGTLVLRVHMLPHEPDSRARVVNSDRVPFNVLIKQGSVTAIRFEGFSGVSFALYGAISDDSDVQLDDLVIYLDRPHTDDQDRLALEARNTHYGNQAIRAAPRLRSMEPARLDEPVSQTATKEQFRSPAFAAWRERLGLPESDPGAWCGAFALEALRCFGMIEGGARALAISDVGSGVPALFAERGVETTFLTPGPPPAAIAGVIHRDGEATGLPRDLVNFDFAWSDTVLDPGTPVSERFGAYEEVLGRLRPRGLFVTTCQFDMASLEERAEGRIGALNRFDIERLALILISRNFEVAQIKFDLQRAIDWSTDGSGIGRFGFIARKMASGF